MRIDLFTHFVPPAFSDYVSRYRTGAEALSRWRNLPALVDLDTHFRLMDGFDDYAQVPSMANPPIEALGDKSVTPEIARVANDAMAELCRAHPGRFPSFVASLPLNDVEASIAEARRAVETLGAGGVLVYTNVLGRPLSDPEYFPLFEAMHALDRPVWIHPFRGPGFADYAGESMSFHEIWFTFGWPYETAAAMARLVFAGLFDRLPGIKIVTHHMGGLVPYLEGKIAIGFRQGAEGMLERNPVAEEAGLKRPPLDYFRMFHADTAVNGTQSSLDAGLAFYGSERAVFASDAPFDPTGGRYLIDVTLKAIDESGLAPAEREAVLEGNARRLLGLDAG